VIFLMERPDIMDWIGLSILATSVIAVQLSQNYRKKISTNGAEAMIGKK